MANLITCSRIVCALIMFFCPIFSMSFYLLYILGSITDILDGIAARSTGKETKLGARLDTVADIVFVAVVLIKVLQKVRIPLWLVIWIVSIAVIKCVNIVSGIVISGHFVSEHTVLNRISGGLVFAVVLFIRCFPAMPVVILIILTCAAATAAAVQEGYYIRKR